jgi:LAS superfamily LD-carboxypeptidase LdcB
MKRFGILLNEGLKTAFKQKSRLFYLTLLLIIAGGYLAFDLYRKNRTLNRTAAALEESLKSSENFILNLKTQNESLAQVLEERESENTTLKNEVRKVTKTATALEKLAKTDPELLQKYSKTYFLNEHYVPSKLENIDPKYIYSKDKKLEMHKDAYPFLTDLIEDALADGVDLKISSAYRSFGTQADLKAGYKLMYGAGTANQFSAEQGYSEHQLGTAVDFTTNEIGGGLDGFQNTAAYEWLLKNAYKYGFVISYPQGNKYYMFEPWHWRFVGDRLARKLYREKKYFYDLDQREIDSYLVRIFD